MNINTKAEMDAFIDKAIEYNKKHPKTYTIEEVQARLKKISEKSV